MATKYTLLVDMQNKVLKGLIRTSESIYMLSKHDQNRGSINLALSGVTMNPNYYGFHVRFEFRFEDPFDALHYNIYKETSTEGSTHMILIGTGFTNVNLTIANIFTIAAAGWSGVVDLSDLPNRMDIIQMETDSHISIAAAESVCNDIECWIDEKLREESLIIMAEGASIPNDLYFVVYPPVPRLINVATMYLWAFRLIDDHFRATRQYDSIKGRSDDDQPNVIAWGWMKEGIKALAQYIKSRNVQLGNAPKWSGVAPLQTTVGVPGVGMVIQNSDIDFTDSSNDINAILSWYLGDPYVSGLLENINE